MKWNDGKERAKFNAEQDRLRQEYLDAGMTEEQIKTMYKFDKTFYNERRREAVHTQELDIQAFDDDGEDELRNSLLDKFMDKLSVTDKHFQDERYGWIENIENERLCIALKSLPDADKELLTKYIVDGLSQTEIAKKEGVVKVVICKKIKRIKTFLKNFLLNG
ncbi:MAG: sigma-70 family RNA polymerase sigma factor [Lachnospiraceae bacterium]|nr:sigma-70 family RNA polymerase sigma factor [Lachnospiraceae bacterium]